MSFSKEITVWCDSCPKWVKPSGKTFSTALKRVREKGWTSPEWGEHYCPDCSGGNDAE